MINQVKRFEITWTPLHSNVIKTTVILAASEFRAKREFRKLTPYCSILQVKELKEFISSLHKEIKFLNKYC